MHAAKTADRRASQSEPELDVVIVTYNSSALIGECLESVKAASVGRSVRVIVVDNASQDGTADFVAQRYPDVTLVRSAVNVGFAAGCNQGMRCGNAELQLMLNPDARIAPDALDAALSHMRASPRCGIVGARLQSPGGELQPSARKFPGPLRKLFGISGLSARFPDSSVFGSEFSGLQRGASSGSVDWVVGAFFLLRRSMLEEIGLFDERFFLYFEEIDLCLRAKQAGWTVDFHPAIRAMHIGGASAQTAAAVSRTGRQISAHRIRSEMQYYQKNFGTARMLGAWGVEFLWQSLVFARNIARGGAEGSRRRTAACSDLRTLAVALGDSFK